MIKITYYDHHQWCTTDQPNIHLLEHFDRYDLFDEQFEPHDINSLLKRPSIITTNYTGLTLQRPIFYADLLILESNDHYGRYVVMPYFHTTRGQLMFKIIYRESADEYIASNIDSLSTQNLTTLYQRYHQYLQLPKSNKTHQFANRQGLMIHQLTTHQQQNLNLFMLLDNDELQHVCDQFNLNQTDFKHTIANLIPHLPTKLTEQDSLPTQLKEAFAKWN